MTNVTTMNRYVDIMRSGLVNTLNFRMQQTINTQHLLDHPVSVSIPKGAVEIRRELCEALASNMKGERIRARSGQDFYISGISLGDMSTSCVNFTLTH